MSEKQVKRALTPSGVLAGKGPLVLVATLEPIVGDRFQPAGFPEIGHVMYKAPRKNGPDEHVCIVDSAASMANHLESVCMRGAHDLDLVDDLTGMPYVRCVTGTLNNGKLEERELVVTSLTEGHRIASSYFLDGKVLTLDGGRTSGQVDNAKKPRGKKSTDDSGFPSLQDKLIADFGIALPGSSRAHPPPEKWWNVFKTVYAVDPNSLVHGLLFPQWQIKIPRFLTAHLEAFGASRVDRSGVKFDRLGKTTSGQPIFAVDDATARAIRATFIFDLSLVRSFGRKSGEKQLGLSIKEKEFLVALALWKVQQLLASPFRFRSGCHLQCTGVTSADADVELDVDIKQAIKDAGFGADPVTDVYWPREELYREGEDGKGAEAGEDDQNNDDPAGDD